ncbi:MAG: protease [Phycisphaerales bacterium]|jgi:protease-4|nr:protease [Phycisphaerales bacterium]MEA2734140.1 protease [Humisphaera sp.]
MIPQPPPGQGPIDPRGAFAPPPPPHHQQQQYGGFQPAPPPGFGPMGPGMYPPPPPMFMMPPQQPPRRGGGFVRAIMVTFATVIFGASLTLNLYLLTLTGLAGSGGRSQQTNVLTGDPKQKIAHVPIKGIIMEEAFERFDRMMKSVEADGDVKAVVIEIDSPGGSVTASDEIHNRILKYKKEKPGVPIVVSMAGLAASGGYYVACPADYIFAQPTTLTGNIGVLMPQYNVAELFEKWGIKETTVESSGTPFKNAGSMFRAEKAEDRAYIQDIADKAFAQFKDVVAKGRQSKLKKPLAEIANGKIYMAADAEALGLIDKIGYLPDAYDHAATQAKLTNRTIVKYHDPPNFLDTLMSGKSNIGPGAGGAGGGGHSVNINGIQVNAGDLRELLTPRLMYLWRGQ